MRELREKIKEALISALPVTAIVYILALTPLFDLSATELITFSAGAVLLVLGIGFFSLGADLAMTPMGTHVGSGLSRQKKLGLLLSVCFVLGLLITIAEPDLQVLAGQVSAVMNGTVLIYAVGLGVGLFLVVAILKIVFRRSLSQILMLFYMLLFALALMLVVRGNEALLPMGFDSGGVTTGPITVPFIMALGVGISSVLGERRNNENSFGLVSLCSVGPILAVLILGIFYGNDLDIGELLEKFSTLIDGLLMREDLFDVSHFSAGISQQIVIDLQTEGTHNGEVMADHQIVHFFYRACGGILQR